MCSVHPNGVKTVCFSKRILCNTLRNIKASADIRCSLYITVSAVADQLFPRGSEISRKALISRFVWSRTTVTIIIICPAYYTVTLFYLPPAVSPTPRFRIEDSKSTTIWTRPLLILFFRRARTVQHNIIILCRCPATEGKKKWIENTYYCWARSRTIDAFGKSIRFYTWRGRKNKELLPASLSEDGRVILICRNYTILRSSRSI